MPKKIANSPKVTELIFRELLVKPATNARQNLSQ